MKPRIFWSLVYEDWACQGGWKTGRGDSPAAAYAAWLKAERQWPESL